MATLEGDAHMKDIDKELLELSAKAHGGLEFIDGNGWIEVDAQGNRGYWWNPLTNDGDALRLAVKLHLEIAIHETLSGAINGNMLTGIEEHNDDPYKATRLAIVRAAAEIGRLMK